MTNPYANNELYLDSNQQASTLPITFTTWQAVANRFGSISQETQFAKSFFNGGGSTFFIARDAVNQRVHLLGADLAGDSLAQLQAIKGTVSDLFDGFNYSGSIDGSSITEAGFNGVQQLGHLLQAALDAPANRQTAAVVENVTITPETATFKGYINRAQFYITQVLSGTLEVGGRLSVAGSIGGNQGIVINIRPDGHGSTFANDGNVGSAAHPVTITETYGDVTIGGVKSGTVGVGLELTDKVGDLVSKTMLDNELANGHYITANSQSINEAQMRLIAPPLTVSTDGNGREVSGPNGPIAYLSMTSDPAAGFDATPSSMSLLGGTAAEALGLGQDAWSLASPGGQNITIAQNLNQDQALLSNQGTGFGIIATNEHRLYPAFDAYVNKHPDISFPQGGH